MLPTGSETSKTDVAKKVFASIVQDSCWRNVLLLHPGLAVYEMRIAAGYGLRWTLDLDHDKSMDSDQACHDNCKTLETSASIHKVTFRGFLEPPASSAQPTGSNANSDDMRPIKTSGSKKQL